MASYKVTSLTIGLQTGSDSTYYATWSFSKSHVASYTVQWYYATGDGFWYDGGSSSVTLKNATYSAPSNAKKIKVKVTPVSTTYETTVQTATTTNTSSGSNTVTWSGYTPTVSSGSSSSGTSYTTTTKTVSYWTGSAATATYTIVSLPEEPSAPTLSLGTVSSSKTVVIATVDTTDSYTEGIQFVYYRATSITGDYTKLSTVSSTVSGGQATVQKSVDNGYYYKVRCRGYRTISSKKNYGDYSDYSDDITTPPGPVTNLKVTGASSTSIKVSWTAPSTATKYTVEYVISSDEIAGYKLFGTGSSEVQEITDITSTTTYLTGLESGYKYYVRVKALNDDDQESTWVGTTGKYYCTIGTIPEAPTTWSSTTTAYLSGTSTYYVYLYFTHNCEDGSALTGARLRYKLSGDSSWTYSTAYTMVDEDSGVGYFAYGIGTWDPDADFSSNTLQWGVQTRGILYSDSNEGYGDWSTTRSVNIYDEPTLEIVSSEDTMSSYPLILDFACGPDGQNPISITVTVSALELYETTNYDGTTATIRKGQEIFIGTYDSSYFKESRFTMYLSASEINLEDDVSYRVSATVSLDSGLTADATFDFDTEFDADEYDVNASVDIDKDALVAYIRPWAEYAGEDTVYKGTDVTLGVYRREPDGTFTEIETGISAKYGGSLAVSDPHPALDYARYRIVAVDSSNSNVFYSDIPDQPVLEPSIVIQWDEDWQVFNVDGSEDDDGTPWAGSMIKIPYNIDVSETNDIDVSLVEYIGRDHPVSYYGTQKGYSASWSCEIPKTDTEMLAALRRLAIYAGDVYVREPSGTGYWAQIAVSMNLNHCELTVPVSFSIKRVEGGA